MKFLFSMLFYFLAALFLCWGILRLIKGDPWLLIFSAAVYGVMLAKIGCLPKKSH